MITSNLTRRTFLAALFLGSASLVAGCASSASDDEDSRDAKQEEAVPRIALLIDQTGSFTENLPAAAEIIQRFIKENAVAGSAEVYLISVDRSPRVIEYFPAEQLLTQQSSTLLKKITVPNPLDGTDIVGALRLAQEKLTKDNGTRPGKQFLLCMSDMYVDGQTNPKKEFPKLDAFAWDSLRGMDVRFYFVAHDNEALVTRLLQQAGVKGLVLDPAESRKQKPAESVEEGGE